ncbi:DUF3592 domain-containing protein [Niabella hirudinis]|uniref:DUF3592 domain-containing protein n=1 Tax=Niabella hirudinis TaxID=1285929 RepID=UPI003EBAA2F5
MLNILLVIVSLLGFLPFVIFLYKRRRHDRIIDRGSKTDGVIFSITPGVRGRYGMMNENVHFYFIAPDGRQYKGLFVTAPDKCRQGDELEVYYLPENPNENTVKAKGRGVGFLIFTLVIAAAVVWMMYKVYQMTKGSTQMF